MEELGGAWRTASNSPLLLLQPVVEEPLRWLGRRIGRSQLEQRFLLMSQHRSLRGTSSLAAKRNVLKRFERLELLKKRGVWKPGSRITGLPKTKPEA